MSETGNLLNVFPSDAPDDTANLGQRKAECVRQLTAGHQTFGVQSSNFLYLLGGQLCHAVRLTLLARLAILLIPICAILGLGSSKQVSRIAAQRIVAGVANKVAVLDRAIGQFVGDAMGRKHLPIGILEFAVAFDDSGAPLPTGIGGATVNLIPKAFDCVWGKARGMIGGHQNLQFWCLIRGRCRDAARYFYCVLPVYFSTNELEGQYDLA